MLSIMCTNEFVVTNRFSDQTKKVNYVWTSIYAMCFDLYPGTNQLEMGRALSVQAPIKEHTQDIQKEECWLHRFRSRFLQPLEMLQLT
jgi:hypothetical protein